MIGASTARSVGRTISKGSRERARAHAHRSRLLTLTLHSPSIDARAPNEDVIYNGENTFTTDPVAMFTADAAVVEHGCLIHLYPSSIHRTRERYLVGMKIIET